MKMRVEELTKIYSLGTSRIMAVDRASFEIDENSFTAIVGRSGSGKSTLLNLIGLNDTPTSGTVFIDDVDAFRLPSRKRREARLHRIGFIFQTFNLLPTLSAVENVELPMALAGRNPKDQRERAVKLLETVGLADRRTHRPKQLSMGEMQRVAIARALANDPKILIADEPTGELDSKTAQETITLLFDIHRKKKTAVIVATHDEKLVDRVDSVLTIEDGRLSHGR